MTDFVLLSLWCAKVQHENAFCEQHSHTVYWLWYKFLTTTASWDRYLSGPHARVHRALTGRQHCYRHWQRDWSRDERVTVAQIRTGSSSPAQYRAPGLGHLPTLWRRRRNSRTSGVPMSCPRSGQEGHVAWRHLYNKPTMPLELPGTNFLTGNERERVGEREKVSASKSLPWLRGS